MRDIKFRALVGGQWFYGDILNWAGGAQIWADGHNFIVKNKETIGQYIGLKDKNGVEIYEGDICEISGANYRYTFEIVWDEQAAGFGFNQVMHGLSDLDFMPDYLDWNEMMIDKIDRVRVIGNIYENPELLK